jgi:hypothetical protein
VKKESWSARKGRDRRECLVYTGRDEGFLGIFTKLGLCVNRNILLGVYRRASVVKEQVRFAEETGK